jgi:hypothetical protein
VLRGLHRDAAPVLQRIHNVGEDVALHKLNGLGTSRRGDGCPSGVTKPDTTGQFRDETVAPGGSSASRRREVGVDARETYVRRLAPDRFRGPNASRVVR